jgi:hypothetical protein
MAFAGFGWLAFLSPPIAKHLSLYLEVPDIVAEASLMLWLLAKSVNVQRWNEQARAAEASTRTGSRFTESRTSIRLFAEGYAKCEESSFWRAMLRPNELWVFSHFLPDTKRNGIHVKQSYLFSTFASLTVNADRGEKPCLAGFLEVGSHAQRRSVPDVLHLFNALSDDLVI